jgi:hypothetical protein
MNLENFIGFLNAIKDKKIILLNLKTGKTMYDLII